MTVSVATTAITQSAGAMRLNNPPRIKSTMRSGRSVFNEVSKKRIAGSEGKKSQSRAAFGGRFRKKAVDHFKAGAVTAYGDEFSVAVIVRPAREDGSLPRSARFAHFEAKPRCAELFESSCGQFSTTSAARGGIHNGKIGFIHRDTIAPRSSPSPICPARMTRLIFIAALRGKS